MLEFKKSSSKIKRIKSKFSLVSMHLSSVFGLLEVLEVFLRYIHVLHVLEIC